MAKRRANSTKKSVNKIISLGAFGKDYPSSPPTPHTTKPTREQPLPFSSRRGIGKTFALARFARFHH
jgi:hypothetical protein